jgi:hypothetical protein
MCVRGVVALRAGDSMGIVLLAFGGIGGSYAIGDLYFLRRHRYRGTFRIADHLSRMLAGTIAAVTAFTVVNVRLEPAVLVWLTPAVALTPLIVYWNVRVRRQTTSEGRRPGDGGSSLTHGGCGPRRLIHASGQSISLRHDAA